TIAGSLHYVMEFDITFPAYLASGSYAIRFQLEDTAQNLVAYLGSVQTAYGSLRPFPPGFPSALTVVHQPSIPASYSAVPTIPHLATGGGWQTTLHTSGLCSADCTLITNTYDTRGTLINKIVTQVPSSSRRWARSDDMPSPTGLTTGGSKSQL